MKQFIKLSTTVGLVAIVLSTTVFSFAMAAAGDLPTTQPNLPDVSTVANLFGKINTMLNWVFLIAVVISVLFVLIAGFDFITAGGDAAKLSTARQRLIWAVVGIVVAALAKGLPMAIAAMLGVTYSS